MLSLIYSSTLNQRHKIYKEETKTNKRQCPEPSKEVQVQDPWRQSRLQMEPERLRRNSTM